MKTFLKAEDKPLADVMDRVSPEKRSRIIRSIRNKDTGSKALLRRYGGVISIKMPG